MTDALHVTDAVIVQPGDRRRIAEEVALGYLARFRGVTRVNYTLGLKQWFQFCEDHNIEVLAAKRAHIDLYMRHMEEVKGYARSTVCGKSNPVVGYYGYAAEEGYIAISPAQYVKRPWAERISTSNGLTRQELHAILELAQARSVDHAVVCLLGLNGLRVGELCAIQIEHLGQDKWHPTLWLPNRKGGKAQHVPLANRTAFAVNAVRGDRTEGQLFFTGRGNPMTRFQAGRIVARLAKRGGVSKRITPHSFRHAFVTLSLNAGASTRDVMISAGHADERMVAFYDRAKTQLSRNTTHALSAFIEGAD